MFTAILQDVRYTLRQWRRAPGFALTAITVLALGLGANIAVFTLVSGLFLRSLPYADAGRIALVNLDDSRLHPDYYAYVNYANMLQLRDATGGRMQMAGSFGSTPASIVGTGGRIQAIRTNIDASMLRMLGVQPLLGRVFRDDESQPGREHVVVLGEEAWQKLFNGDRSVVGQPLTIRGQIYTIVGVMPRGFSFPFESGKQIWTPEPLDAQARTSMDNQIATGGQMFVRIPDGVTVAQLQADLNRVQPVIAKQTAHGRTAPAVKVTPYQQSLNDRARKPLLLLYAVVAGIWALACLNVMSLMLARAIARTREQAVRSALGASRARLVAQSVTESLMLSIAGALAGLLLAQSATRLLWKQIEKALPMTDAVQLDWRVVAGLGALSLVTALLTGIVPALRASARNPGQGLGGVTTTASTGQNRIREGLVVGQLALTLVFLVGAGLFLRTINALRAVPLGFSQTNVLTGGIILDPIQQHLDNGRSDAKETPNIVQSAYLPLLDRLRAIPGVQVAALSSVLPMYGEFAVTINTSTLDGHERKDSDSVNADGRIASANLTDALGIPMLRGRFFTESDTNSASPVAVVNKAFADKYLPGKDPVGHTFSMGQGRYAQIRIVGEIANIKQEHVTAGTRPEVYFCLAQMAPGAPLYAITSMFMQVAIRGAIPAEALRSQFDRVLHEVAPDATTTDVKTIHEAVEDSFGSQTLTAHLLEGFAALALMIASVGLYGLLSFTVAQRTREIGVRIALGASKENILGLVLKRASVLAVVGLSAGTAMAWFAVKLAHGYLYGVEAHDAETFALVMIVLTVAALAAAWLPARRAAAVDPMLALRSE